MDTPHEVDEDDGDPLTWSPDVPVERLVKALGQGASWAGGVGSVPEGTWVVAAAGAWGDLGCVVVLHRCADGLEHDVHVVPRARSGPWRPTGNSSGTSLPEWVLERPDTGPEQWRGTQTQVVADQINGYAVTHGDEPRTLWGAGVGVLCSRRVDQLELVHRSPTRDLERRVVLPVPPSGWVAFACPVVHPSDTVLLRALDAGGVLLSQETYEPLTDLDGNWPDETLWATAHGE